jgi:hypothetical protein
MYNAIMNLPVSYHRSPKICELCTSVKTKLICPFTNNTLCQKCRQNNYISKTETFKIYPDANQDIHKTLNRITIKTGYGNGMYFFRDDVWILLSTYQGFDMEAYQANENRKIQDKKRKKIELIEHIQQQDSLRQTRRKELKTALQNYGLKLRSDSRLCENYIYEGDHDIDDVVERMCQMKYLFEYCNIRAKIKELKKKSYYIPNNELFERAEEDILISQGGEYPEQWPWLLNK